MHLPKGAQGKEQGQDSNSGLPGSRLYPLTTTPHGPVPGRGEPREAVALIFGTTAGPGGPSCSAELRPSLMKPGSPLLGPLLSSFCVPGPVLSSLPH